MSGLFRVISLIELVLLTAFIGYTGVLLLPESTAAGLIFFFGACLPLYALLRGLISKKHIVRAPMDGVILNVCVLVFAFYPWVEVPADYQPVVFGGAALLIIDIVANILNYISPQKAFITLRSETATKVSVILTLAEIFLPIAAGIVIAPMFDNMSGWILAITGGYAVVMVIYILRQKRLRKITIEPFGGIIIDTIFIAYTAVMYSQQPEYHAIIAIFMAIAAVDLGRCLIRNAYSITSLDQL